MVDPLSFCSTQRVLRSPPVFLLRLKDLLGGRVVRLTGSLKQPCAAWMWLCVVTILLGAGFYGFTLGWWHSPERSLFTAIKFPLLISALRPFVGKSDRLLPQTKLFFLSHWGKSLNGESK